MPIIKTFVLSALFIISTVLHATPINTAPLLVLDMKNTPTYPKKFRTTSNPLPVYPGKNDTGFAELHAAGSAQFSVSALEKVLERLGTRKVLIIDLRQESHGFLNGNAISWFAPKNAINAGKTPQQIEIRQAALLKNLGEQKTANVYSIIDKNEKDEILKTKEIEMAVHSVNTEEEIAEKKQVRYVRLYVQDHHAPTEKEVDRFLEIVKSIPNDTWVYFHCRGGAGRTTTFMAMYDMLRNAKEVSFDEIMKRQIAIGGKDITTLPVKSSPRYKSAAARLAFLQEFYESAKN